MRTLTCTLRIPTNPDQKNSDILLSTMQEYSKAAQIAYNFGRFDNTVSRIKIHHAIYKDFRKTSSLNSQLVINGKNKGVDVLRSLKKRKKKDE